MEYKFETINCALCGANDTIPLAEKGHHGLPAHVVICRKCGFVYLNPRWTRASYHDFYSNKYDEYYRRYLVNTPKQQATTPGPAGKSASSVKFVVPALERMKEHNLLSNNVSAILDVGSGDGASFLDPAKALYGRAACFAIEASSHCFPMLQRKGVQVISDDVDSDWHVGRENSFDMIHMRHVLEHFLDPVSVLKKAAHTLKDNGILYVAVPDTLHPGLPLIKYFFRSVHTYYFNKYTLPAIGKKAGLEPILVLEGDRLDKHEIVVIFKKGKAIEETVNCFEEQYRVLKKYIDHETGLSYRLRSAIRRLLGTEKKI